MKKLLFVFLILTATGADAELNKWVDAQGKVHYSDQPPPVGIETTKLHAAPSPASAPAPSKSFSERDAELKRARQSQTEAAEKAAQEKSNADIEKANCTSAKQTLSSLKQDGRIVELSENGERRYIEDSDRQQRADKAQAEVDKWCK